MAKESEKQEIERGEICVKYNTRILYECASVCVCTVYIIAKSTGIVVHILHVFPPIFLFKFGQSF